MKNLFDEIIQGSLELKNRLVGSAAWQLGVDSDYLIPRLERLTRTVSYPPGSDDHQRVTQAKNELPEQDE